MAIHLSAAALLSPHLSSFHRAPAQEPREALLPALPVHIEHPTAAKSRRATSAELQTLSGLSPPQPAALTLPHGWAKQDFGNKASSDTAVWLDWTKRRTAFVPRVFLWQRKAETPYMRPPSLRDAVDDVVASLQAKDVRIYASKAQRVCSGTRPGWFFAYVNLDDDPPVELEETVFFARGTIYRATYIRPANEPEDPATREALNTLCSPR